MTCFFSWQMSWFRFWDAWKYFLNSLSGSLQLQLCCYKNKSCNAVLYAPYFPFNSHSGNILNRFCVRHVLSKLKPLHAKYADWNFHAKLEENTFSLCLECSNSCLLIQVLCCHSLEKWFDNQWVEKLLQIWPSLMNAQKSQCSWDCLATSGSSLSLQKLTLSEISQKWMNTNSAEITVKSKEMQWELNQNAELRLMWETFLDWSFEEWENSF